MTKFTLFHWCFGKSKTSRNCCPKPISWRQTYTLGIGWFQQGRIY